MRTRTTRCHIVRRTPWQVTGRSLQVHSVVDMFVPGAPTAHVFSQVDVKTGKYGRWWRYASIHNTLIDWFQSQHVAYLSATQTVELNCINFFLFFALSRNCYKWSRRSRRKPSAHSFQPAPASCQRASLRVRNALRNLKGRGKFSLALQSTAAALQKQSSSVLLECFLSS